MRQMGDTEDDARHPHNKPYSDNIYGSSHRPKPHLYPPPPVDQYDDEEDQDDESEENDEENHEAVGYGNGYGHAIEDDEDFERYPKKRKLKNLASGYEFAPRMSVPDSAKMSNSGSYWSDSDTALLLDAWGDRFLQLGRKSLRSEDWRDIAEKVSEMAKTQRTEGQCRNRLDVLKKKYRKEKERVKDMGLNSSKWMFFKKMDMLLNSPPRQESGLACGVDSGEYVFMNPRVYLDRSNGMDEMRDSPEESEADDDDDNDSDGLPPRRVGGNSGEDGASFRLLANSIQKFGAIYEKIESSKRQQMMELERMRIDFNKELELQKKHIVERAQAEIAKMQEDDMEEEEEEEDADDSAESLSE